MAFEQITLVTGNKNKLSEVNAILGDAIRLKSQSLHCTCTAYRTTRLTSVVEIQGTIEEISVDKCRRAASILREPVVVEDTCLAFNALGGLPGPYIKWFFDALGLDGLNNLLAAYEDKSAEAICTFAYSNGEGEQVRLFTGVTKGTIVSPRGNRGFAFDPIFQPIGEILTYAEMTSAKKNQLSERYKALAQLRLFLES